MCVQTSEANNETVARLRVIRVVRRYEHMRAIAWEELILHAVGAAASEVGIRCRRLTGAPSETRLQELVPIALPNAKN